MSWINNKSLLDFPAAALEYFYEIIFGDNSPQGVITDFNRNVDETTTQQTLSSLASLLAGDEIYLYIIFLSVSFFHLACLCRLSVIYFFCIYFHCVHKSLFFPFSLISILSSPLLTLYTQILIVLNVYRIITVTHIDQQSFVSIWHSTKAFKSTNQTWVGFVRYNIFLYFTEAVWRKSRAADSQHGPSVIRWYFKDK